MPVISFSWFTSIWQSCEQEIETLHEKAARAAVGLLLQGVLWAHHRSASSLPLPDRLPQNPRHTRSTSASSSSSIRGFSPSVCGRVLGLLYRSVGAAAGGEALSGTCGGTSPLLPTCAAGHIRRLRCVCSGHGPGAILSLAAHAIRACHFSLTIRCQKKCLGGCCHFSSPGALVTYSLQALSHGQPVLCLLQPLKKEKECRSFLHQTYHVPAASAHRRSHTRNGSSPLVGGEAALPREPLPAASPNTGFPPPQLPLECTFN